MGDGGEAQSAADHPITQRLREIAGSGRPATDDEIARIRAHVAAAGFDPASGRTKVGPRLAGHRWRGRILRAGDRLANGEIHYLKHVVDQQEWPSATTFEHYIASLRRAVSDANGGVAIEWRSTGWQVLFLAPSGASHGPEGRGWILVVYPVEYGYWSTGYQPELGLDHVRLDESRGERWLRRPRDPSASTTTSA